jgi:hypothetical protein
MLDGWHEYYELLGTSAAALLALLFVAASIGASVLTYDRAGPTRTYLSPVVFHYSNILFLSLLALIPTQTPLTFGLTILIAAAASLIYSIFIFARLLTDGIADLPDRIAYGAVPIVAYAAGVIAAYLLLTHAITASLNVIAGASLLLLVVNIRNAWDLLIALARRATQAQPGRGDAGTPPPPGATRPPSP